MMARAGIAQLVEHLLPKQRVAGSSPVSRSNVFTRYIRYEAGHLARLSSPLATAGFRDHLLSKQRVASLFQTPARRLVSSKFSAL